MRALIWQLKPVGLEHGLVNAIKRYCELIGIEPEIQVEGLIDLSSSIEEHVYRIVQEAVNNIKKHTSTHQVHLSLTQTEHHFNVTIADEGKGFNSDLIGETSHGIHNMKQRIKQIHGQIEINSVINQGTSIQLQIPVTSRDKEHE